MKKIALIFILAALVFSCTRVKQKTKETINEGGEIVGKAATEFAEGVSEGAERTLDCDISLSDNLKSKGLKTGDYFVGQDSSGGDNNVLRLYFIFDKDYEGTVTAKLFAKNGLESGRTKVKIDGVSGDAKYFDFAFDKRTHIEVKSKITIE
ncbi:MAG: hypothetical protein ACKVQB_07985 [Bacteroidia bacterium]